MSFTFHIPGIPHTATNKDYLCCAFTQKVLNLCKMLTERGHKVIHYGNELSDVVCTEHVTVTDAADIGPPETSGKFDVNSAVYGNFHHNTVEAINARKQPGDFLLCAWASHKSIADECPGLIVVESGIGYPGGYFAPYKVFESYALLHAYRGTQGVGTAQGNAWWYDAVIPNYYDLADFTFNDNPGGYLAFLGVRSIGGEGKGDYIAMQIAKEVGLPLVMAGPGTVNNAHAPAQLVGFVGVEKRREILSNARAVLTPSMFVEPFCGVSVEAMLSGTPVITTDWGAFAENVLHGVTGYRCRTFEQFVWAAQNIHKIDRRACRDWAASNFSLERVGAMYEEYFQSVADAQTGKRWYTPRSDRTDLDWLKRNYPMAA